MIDGGEAGGAVTVDGRVVGDAPVHAVLSADGVSYIGLQPSAPRRYGVTRRLVFEGGRLSDCPPDVEAYSWSGGLYELSLRCGTLPEERERRFPFTLTRRAYEGAEAVLYWEDGLWLSIERGGRVQAGFFLHESAGAGELIPWGRQLAAVAHGDGARDRAVILNERFESVQEIEADAITAEADGALVCLDALPSPMGRQRRAVWRADADGPAQEAAEAGFFTAEPRPCPAGLCLLDALMYGADGEAAALLSPALGTDAETLRAFLGAYSVIRAHPADAAKAGIGHRTDGVTELRTLTFETDGGKIVNILEES